MRGFAIAGWILRLGLAGVYLFAAVPKLADPLDFARAIFNYRILPETWIVPLALWLPPVEALAAIAILTGTLYRGGILCVTVLSGIFAIAIGSAVVRGLDISCGCFGTAATSGADIGHIVLNLAIVAVGIILLVGSSRRGKTLPRPG